jgi:hypothetical protein
MIDSRHSTIVKPAISPHAIGKSERLRSKRFLIHGAITTDRLIGCRRDFDCSNWLRSGQRE